VEAINGYPREPGSQRPYDQSKTQGWNGESGPQRNTAREGAGFESRSKREYRIAGWLQEGRSSTPNYQQVQPYKRPIEEPSAEGDLFQLSGSKISVRRWVGSELKRFNYYCKRPRHPEGHNAFLRTPNSM
jgi:hypothetical protein